MRNEFRLLSVLCALNLGGCGGGAESLLQQVTNQSYTLAPINPLPGDTNVTVMDLNNVGQVIGYSSRSGTQSVAHPFIITNGVQRALPTPSNSSALNFVPQAINNAGAIVGVSYPQTTGNTAPTYTPVLWQGNVIQTLPVASLANDTGLHFVGINTAGGILGQDATGPFLYSNAVLTRLPTGSNTEVGVTGLNDSGDVVGYSNLPDFPTPLYWHNGALSPLAIPTSTETQGTALFAINNRGDILGRFDTGSGYFTWFLLSSGQVTTTFPPSPRASLGNGSALSLNNGQCLLPHLSASWYQSRLSDNRCH